MKSSVKPLLVLMSLLVTIPMSWSQTSNQGAMVGTITDETGSVIPGARVTVINVDTGARRSVLSNPQGEYRADFLLPGKYEVNAEVEGFKKHTLSDLTVRVGEALRADVKMEVGALTQEVNVSSTTAAVNTETASLGDVVTTSAIRNLPLNGREFIQLASLVPGAESGNPKKGFSNLDKGNKGFMIGFNGARTGYNSYFIDGAQSTDPQYNDLISSPSLDAIKEFQVETNMYSAQYGRSGGAVINVVTNSGTNAFHGTLFEFHRNKALDARPTFFTAPKANVPMYLRNQFGGAIGGPIRKNKTFFFASGEWFRQKKPSGLLSTFAPTDLERAGDMSQSINPYTGKPVVLINPYTQEVIPDGKVPANLMDPVGVKLMSLWQPGPNYTGDPFLNLRLFRGSHFNQNKWLARVDQQFSEKTTLYGSFTSDDYDNVQPGHTAYSDTDYLEHDRTLAVTYTHTFSPTVVNDLKGSFTRYSAGTHFVLEDKNYAEEWGMWAGTKNPINGSPRLLMYTLGNQFYGIGAGGFDSYKQNNVYLRDNLVFSTGKHTLVVGGDFLRQQFDWYVAEALPVTLYFGLLDGSPGLESTYGVSGSTFSDLLMGLSSRHTYGISASTMPLRRTSFSLHLQHSWKVNPRLTLNPGLRFDYEPAFSAADNQYATLDFQTGLPRYADGVPKDKLALTHFPYETGSPNRPFAPHKNFSPRISFAFAPFKDRRTVIRGGYGLFFTSENAWATEYGAWVAPFRGEFNHYDRAFAWPDGQDHFVPISQEPFGYDYALGASPGYSVAVTPQYPAGYLGQWNFSVGRDFGGRIAAELAYVGTKGTNLNSQSSVDQLYPALSAKVASQVPGWYIGLASKGYNSKYHSLQAKVRKDVSHGLFFLAAYTWSHAMAEASADELNQSTLVELGLGSSIIKRRYSAADFDVRQRFSLSGGWDVPVGRGMAYGENWNAVADGFLGGWTLNTIVTFQGGYPFTVYDASGFLPDRVCDGNLPVGQRSPDRWFDTSCFTTHTPLTGIDPQTGKEVTYNFQGNAGANIITSPGTNNWDMGVQKNFRIAEGKRLQFRAEFFNAFNHPGYIGPPRYSFFNNVSGAKIVRARDQRDIQLGLKFIF